MRMWKRMAIAAVVNLALAAPVLAQSTIFVVRHAERADTARGEKPKMGSDPDLSDAGRQRAESLANILRDANVTAIYATEYKRTQQTAAPLAKALGLKPTILQADKTPDLVERLKTGQGNALVVGHSDTLSHIIKELGVPVHVKVEDTDYDNLFIVTLDSTPRLLRLHYR